jgi:hypothetical protein
MPPEPAAASAWPHSSRDKPADKEGSSPGGRLLRRTITFPDEVVLFHIRYFVVNVPAGEIDITNLLEDERAIYRDHRCL